MAESSGKREMVTTLVVVLLLTLVGAGVGFAAGMLLQAEPQAETAADAAAGDDDAKKAASGGEGQEAGAAGSEDAAVEQANLKGGRIIPLPDILTTLAEPKGKWIRLEGSIMAAAETESSPEALAERSGEQIMGYLRTVHLPQIEGPSGLLGLRDDLNETIKVLSDGEVQAILIHGIVIE